MSNSLPPNQWRESSLGDLAEVAIGGTPSRDNEVFWATGSESGFPWVSIADLKGRTVSETKEQITNAGVLGSNVKLVSPGTVLMSFKLTLGRVAFAGTNLYTNEAIAAFRTNDAIDDTYLYYVLPDAVRCAATDTAIKGATLNKDSLRSLRLRYPEKSNQKKIATILTGIDKTIEKTEALIEKYQQIKAGLMHDLFTRGVLPNGQLRPLTDSLETKHGTLPRDWRIGSLLEATDPARQPILTGPFGADLGNSDFVDDGVPVLRIGNVQQGRLDMTDLLFVSERKARSLARYKVKAGDLLFARQGATTGRNALASDEADGCLINYHIIRVALDHERCSPLFIEAAFSSEIVKRQVERDKGRGTREGINTAQLTGLAFPLAPIDEQRRIANILETHGREQRTAQFELQKLNRQKFGLMQDLLTGKVPVKVGAGETAIAG